MPNHVIPLPRHPQLEIIRTPLSDRHGDEVVEYRVYNFKIWQDGTVVRGDQSVLGDVVWVVVLAILCRYWNLDIAFAIARFLVAWTIQGPMAIWFVLLLIFLYSKTRTVLYQSIIAIPNLGVQLETARGLSLRLPFSDALRNPQWAILKSSTLIPLEQISTIFINEGLRRWRAEYYLAVLQKRGAGISVIFDVTRPSVDVLKEVLHDLRETLFDEYESEAEPNNVGASEWKD